MKKNTKRIGYVILGLIILGTVFWGVDELTKKFDTYTIQSIYNLESGFPKPIPNPLTGNNPTNLIYEVYLDGTALSNTKIIFELVGDGGAVFDDNSRTKNIMTDSQGLAIIGIIPLEEGYDSLKVSISFGTFDNYLIEDHRKYNFGTSP